MEDHSAIYFIHHCAHWQGASAACNERDPPANSRHGKRHTEHTKRYHSCQVLRRSKHCPSKCSQLQRRQSRNNIMGTSGSASQRPSSFTSADPPSHTYLRTPPTVTAYKDRVVTVKLKDHGIAQRHRTHSAAWTKQQVQTSIHNNIPTKHISPRSMGLHSYISPRSTLKI